MGTRKKTARIHAIGSGLEGHGNRVIWICDSDWYYRPLGTFWRAARVGERLSPYVSLCCVAMAVSCSLCLRVEDMLTRVGCR